MKIVVLAGGTSTERAVSIVSGTEVCKALRLAGHRAVLVDVFCGAEPPRQGEPFPESYDCEKARAYMESFNGRIEEMQEGRREFFGPRVVEICHDADMVFLALHGANGEDGRVQAALDLAGIPYTGSGHVSSALAMHKGIAKTLLSAGGVPVPRGITMKRTDDTKALPAGMTLPLVVKTCCGGSSVGVFIVHTKEEYAKALDDGFSYEEEVVIEEYIEGREFSVGVVDGEAYPVIEIAPIEGFYNYENKYRPGSTVETCPAQIPREVTKQMQQYAEMGYKALGLEAYARLDFMMRANGEIFCLEANTLPGMTPTSLLPQEAAALGISFPRLCERLIEVSQKKYDRLRGSL